MTGDSAAFVAVASYVTDETFEETNVQAVLTINPRLVKLVGRSMYEMNPLPLVTRELLQNARDACVRNGVKPDITITFRVEKRQISVICRDNGIGMTPDQLVNDFPQLGRPSKADDKDSVGGFGLAKAAIMSGDFWSVHTLRYYVDIDMLAQGKNIRKAEYLDGTEVTAKIEGETSIYHIRDAFMMIAMSSIQINFRLVDVRYGREELIFEHQVGGIDETAKWKDLAECNWTPGWNMRGSVNVEIPTFRYQMHGDDTYLASYIGGGGGYNLDEHVKGRIFIRVGGLVQFETSSGRDPRRGTVLIVDLKNLPQPGDERYPLSTSRESLKQSFREMLWAEIDPHCKNPVTSHRVVRQKEKQKVAVLPGKRLRGTSGRSLFEDPLQPQKIHSSINRFEAYQESVFRSKVEPDQEDDRANSPIELQILLKEYKRKKITIPDWHALMAWAEIMRMVAPENEEFGVGLTSGEGAAAERVEYDSEVYYVINPEEAFRDVNTLGGKALTLWHLGVHERCHKDESNHGESFTSMMGEITFVTADAMYARLKLIEKLLSGKAQLQLQERNEEASKPNAEQLTLGF